MKNKLKFLPKIEVIVPIVLILCCLFFAHYVSAQNWSAPGNNPPAGNTPAPLNVGNTLQFKNGPLEAIQFRSNQYCDRSGANCFSPGGSGSGIGIESRVFTWSALERASGPGNARGMIHTSSISQRCRELGYDFGHTLRVFVEEQVNNNQRWCRFGNARTDVYAGDIYSPGGARWIRRGCISYENVHTAVCMRVVD